MDTSRLGSFFGGSSTSTKEPKDGSSTFNTRTTTTFSRSRLADLTPPDNMRDEMQELNQRLSNFLADIEALELAKEKLSVELERQRDIYEIQLQQEKDKAEKEIGRLNDYSDKLHVELRDLQRALKNEKANSQSKLNAAQKHHQEEIDELQAEFERRHKSQLDAIRQQCDVQLERNSSRYTGEIETLRQRLANTVEELEKSRNAMKQDPKLAQQVSRLRNENADLQRQLSEAADAHSEKQGDLSARLGNALEELQEVKDAMIDKEMQLTEIHTSYASLEREVKMYRKLLDTEVSRITPSKKRKLTDSRSSAMTNESIEKAEDSQGRRSQGATPARRRSIEQTIAESSKFLEPSSTGQVRIASFSPQHGLVTIVNEGKEDQTIGNWQISAEKTKKNFKFPARQQLKAGGQLTIWSGNEHKDREIGPNELWWTHQTVYSARGETVSLSDASGKEVSSFTE